MRIVVAGGTGVVGREIVAAARARGHEAAGMSRSTGADLQTGEGVAAALRDAEVVIDAVSVATMDAEASTRFFRRSAETLIGAARHNGVRHVVALSIVGVDRNPHGYYAGKVAQEEAYRAGDAPFTIVRATQFHEFAGQVAQQARFGPLQLAPRARVQPIAARAVAEHLVTVAEGAAVGRGNDIAGPREEELSEMIRAWRRHRGERRPVIAVSLPGAQMRGMRRGLALPDANAQVLGPSFAEWLSAQPISAGRAGR